MDYQIKNKMRAGKWGNRVPPELSGLLSEEEYTEALIMKIEEQETELKACKSNKEKAKKILAILAQNAK